MSSVISFRREIVVEIRLKGKEGLMTQEIQKAIDDCFLAGGGTVILEEGRFLTGGIRLRSNCTLYLKSGAILKGTRDPVDYRILPYDRIEPVDPTHFTDAVWVSAKRRKNFDHITKAGGFCDGG